MDNNGISHERRSQQSARGDIVVSDLHLIWDLFDEVGLLLRSDLLDLTLKLLH